MFNVYRDDVKISYKIISGLMIMGYLVYLISSFIYDDFNKGSLYIVASFLICLGLELKIFIKVAAKEINVKKITKKQRSIIFNLIFQLLAHMLYLCGTVIHQIQPVFLTFLPGMINCIGGIALLLATSTSLAEEN